MSKKNMSIIGIGIDILSIKRIKNIITKNLKIKFANRILSNYELNHLPKDKKKCIKFLANRFSVKEAASKAIGTGIRNGTKFSNFELYHNNQGKPYLNFLGKAKKKLTKMNIKNIYVSISDEKLYTCSIVIIEK